MSADSMDSDDESICALVLDNGTRTIKIGVAGDDMPSNVFTNITGKLNPSADPSTDVFVGKAHRDREMLSMDYPMEHGIVVDWDGMEKVWNHAFCSLDCYGSSGGGNTFLDLSDFPVLLTEPVLNPRCNRETMAEIMFEVFKVPAIDVVLPPVLAAYAHGRNTSLCVDIGDGVCSAYPVYEGHTEMAALVRSDLAGRDMTDFLMNDLNVEHGISLSTPSDREMVYKIKEKLCFVASEPEELLSNQTKTYDGIHVSNKVLCKCPEILFEPTTYGFRALSVQQVVYESLMNCSVDKRSLLAYNIMLSGGTCMIQGFQDRLSKEVKRLVPRDMNVRVKAPPEGCYSVWIGGSILASLSTHDKLWITREMYEEFGPNGVFRTGLS